MSFHSTVVFELVLDIYTATYNSTIQITVSLLAYPRHYSRAFAFDSILPIRRIRLAPTPGLRPPREQAVGYFVPDDNWLNQTSDAFHRVCCGYNWSTNNLPVTSILCLLAPACSCSLISLVGNNDGSDTSLLSLLMGSCSMGTGLGFQWSHLFPPLYGLMASRYRRGDAYTAVLAGRDLLTLTVTSGSPSKSSSCQGSVPYSPCSVIPAWVS